MLTLCVGRSEPGGSRRPARRLTGSRLTAVDDNRLMESLCITANIRKYLAARCYCDPKIGLIPRADQRGVAPGDCDRRDYSGLPGIG